jgi:VWFA-related protein
MKARSRPVVGLTMACGLAAVVAGVAAAPQQATFRARTDSVSVDVSVRHGNVPVPGLHAEDFRLWDKQKPQTVESVSLGAVPIDVTIFIDTSGTTIGDLDHLKADVRAMAAMLRPDDRVRLLTFDDQVHDVFGWQSSTADLKLETLSESTASSPIYDALLLALLHKPDLDRRHLIVGITDGLDNGSWTDSATVRDLARRAESVLHIVIIPSGPPLSGPESPGFYVWRSSPDGLSDANLEEAATATGGEFHRAPILNLRNRVIDAFKDAFEDFRMSYVLRFTPRAVPPDGWHDLRVEVVHGSRYTVRARKGYFGG